MGMDGWMDGWTSGKMIIDRWKGGFRVLGQLNSGELNK